MNPSEFLRSVSRAVVRQKFRLARNDSGVWGDEADEGGTVVLRSTEVTVDGNWRISAPAIRHLTASEQRKGLVEAGDLIVTTSSGSRKHIGKTALVDNSVAGIPCAFANFMQRLRVKKGQDPRFYQYLLNAPVGREQMFYLGSTTTGLLNLNGTVLANVEIPDVPPAKQRAIAAFLDRKTAAIDALIDKKERLIALLAEKRAALIHRAVTRGLDEGVPMKDSGVEWIGAIPAHWEVKRLKHVSRFVTSGPRGWGQYYSDEGPLFLRITNVARDEVDLLLSEDKLQSVSPPAGAEGVRTLAAPGDLLVTITADLGSVGVVPHGLGEAYISQHVALCRPTGHLLPRLAAYMVGFAWGPVHYDLSMNGGTKVGLNLDDVRNTPVAVPPSAEQMELLTSLDAAAASLRASSAALIAQLDKLREYRQALITAAVTGRIDIPAKDAA